MSDTTITEAMKQIVITRLATINSATSILSLINGRPAKVTADEVIALAARIEKWAWRGLGVQLSQPQPEGATQPAQETPVTSAAESSPSQQQTPKAPLPKKSAPQPPRPNGHGQRRGEATENQINAIFAIGKAKATLAMKLKRGSRNAVIRGTTALNKQEASTLIEDLNAM